MHIKLWVQISTKQQSTQRQKDAWNNINNNNNNDNDDDDDDNNNNYYSITGYTERTTEQTAKGCLVKKKYETLQSGD